MGASVRYLRMPQSGFRVDFGRTGCRIRQAVVLLRLRVSCPNDPIDQRSSVISVRLLFLITAQIFASAAPEWVQRGPGQSACTKVRPHRGQWLTFAESDRNGILGRSWKSADSGRTWQENALPPDDLVDWAVVRMGDHDILFQITNGSASGKIREMARIDESGSQIVLWGVHGSNPFNSDPITKIGRFLLVFSDSGLQRSSDSGKTWSVVESCLSWGAASTKCPDRQFSAEQTLIASKGQAVAIQGDRIFVSTDTGATWSAQSAKFPNFSWKNAAFLPGTDSMLFSTSGAPRWFVLRSGGWDSGSVVAGWPNDSMHVSATTTDLVVVRDTVWAATARNLFYLDRSNRSWRQVAGALPSDGRIHRLADVDGQLLVTSTAWNAVRMVDGSFRRDVFPSHPRRQPLTSLAWFDDALFACGSNGCDRSSDSGRTWMDASIGMEGAGVVSMTNTGKHLLAATDGFGILVWEKNRWMSVAMEEIGTFLGRFNLVSKCVALGDSLLFVDPGRRETWLRPGAGKPWELVDSIGSEWSARTEGAWWTDHARSKDSLRRSVDGRLWENIASPFEARPHGVGDRLVLTGIWSNRRALREAGTFALDTMINLIPQGDVVAATKDGYGILSIEGVGLFPKSGESVFLPLPLEGGGGQSAYQAVGDRHFVANNTGLWSFNPNASIDGIRPRAMVGARLHGRTLEVQSALSEVLEIQWFEPSGRAGGAISQGVLVGSQSIELPIRQNGVVLIRIRSKGWEKTFRTVVAHRSF